MSLYARGILSHVAAWLVCCAMWPFVLSGSHGSAMARFVGFPLLMFLIGIVPLLIGSTIWMGIFTLPSLRQRAGVFYYLWVGLGAALSLLACVELAAGGDARPSATLVLVPALVACMAAIGTSVLLVRVNEPTSNP